MLEDLFHVWFKEGSVGRKRRPRKAKRYVVCRSPSRGGSTAVGEVVDPPKNDLRTSKGKNQY